MNRDLIKRIIEETADEFGVQPLDILSQNNGSKKTSTARYVCAYLLKGQLPTVKISALLGRRNSQYAYGATTRVQERCQDDYEFHKKVLRLIDAFGLQSR